ncbi:hypothetical protein PoB_001550700 [Plakobranchus ocellatus]|uniref:Uncharacterized protein n=1 Tax=Plakobranchus ocellatus TaxID=259542 RepID=A0AAV3Z3B5_9GAST|nr:hypothetical protein PoB_001550700 [Plakobranchus ocellatus]
MKSFCRWPTLRCWVRKAGDDDDNDDGDDDDDSDGDDDNDDDDANDDFPHPDHNNYKVISGFQAHRQGRTSVAGLELATERSLPI